VVFGFDDNTVWKDSEEAGIGSSVCKEDEGTGSFWVV
jgi:hypothetical protein